MTEYYLTKEDIAKRYGIPEQKKFPLPDAGHVRSAIKFFNYVDPKYERQLAKAILRRAKEYGVDISEMSIGDNNRFKKYLPKQELYHHGIKGQKWGIRRFQNPDGSYTEEGKRRLKQRWVNSGRIGLIFAGAEIVQQLILSNKYDVTSKDLLAESLLVSVAAGAAICHFYTDKKIAKDLGISDETYTKASWAPFGKGSTEAKAELDKLRNENGLTSSALFKKNTPEGKRLPKGRKHKSK